MNTSHSTSSAAKTWHDKAMIALAARRNAQVLRAGKPVSFRPAVGSKNHVPGR